MQSLLIENSNHPNWHFLRQATVPTSSANITHCLVAIEQNTKVREAPAAYPGNNSCVAHIW